MVNILVEEIMSNHLKDGYSNHLFKFISRFYEELDLKNSILDIGCGHYRNLKLFYEFGFKKLYGIDKNTYEDYLEVPVNFKQWDIENGVLYSDKNFDIVLCNFVLMFIEPEKQKFVVNELMRVTKKFLIIETNPLNKSTKNTFYKEYSFKDIVRWIEESKEFEFVQVRKYKEKLIVKRKG
ncbi:class I SAM-dependent methyltransferase [Clostridium aestuarii]|uniref:Class I SAM-dependent methyltransferase n=1 Tax=Clostridium aestuarii TaxID=338193 RepID=A0ABT4D6S2_9CLOT|nr:class I SAM-dependent methyltransferase [Clostridium aestuarii]